MSSKGKRVVHYDIRALDDVRVELYMTVGGQLSRWLFDGEKWTLKENYPLKIKGPFLVCSEGTALVAEVDDHWCVIEEFDTQDPQIHRIVEKVPDEALTVVEDIVDGTNYFLQRDVLYDEDGAEIWSVPRGLKPAARFKSIADFVYSRRSN